MTSAIYGLVAEAPAILAVYPRADTGVDPSLIVSGLSSAPHRLCVRITRAQGGYRARFPVAAPAGIGPAFIAFDSTPVARERLGVARPSGLEMALHVTKETKGRCRPDAPLLPASWTRDASGRYTLLVGGGAVGTPTTRTAGGPLRPCQLISQILRRSDMSAGAFAFSCPVPLPIGPCGVTAPVKILWFRGSRVAGEAEVSVRGLCST